MKARANTPEYTLYASERVSYTATLEAESEQDLVDKIRNGKIDWGQSIDRKDFQVDSVFIKDKYGLAEVSLP